MTSRPGAGADRREAPSTRTLALFSGGEAIEDFLDPLGLSLQAYLEQLTGGWLFGYVEALRTADVRSVVFLVSRRTTRPARAVHAPTGATVWTVPAPRLHRALRARVPWAATASKGAMNGQPRRMARAAASHLCHLLATPVRALIPLLRDEGCDAILCQEYEHPRFEACVLLGRLLRIPVVASFQGGDRALSPLERPLRPLTLRAAHRLIAGPQAEAERVSTRYRLGPARVARVFNPLDLTPWGSIERDRARAELGLPPDAQVVAWHGRVEIEKKGLDVLLEAWRQVLAARGDRDLRLMLVGNGADADELKRRLAGHAGDGVVWHAQYVLEKPELARHLACADVYAFPSRREGFPVAPVEAMACGLPIVAADAFGIADILDGEEEAGGLIIPRGDPAALAQALGRLLDDPALCVELGRRARRRVRERFALPVVGAQLREAIFTTGA